MNKQRVCKVCGVVIPGKGEEGFTTNPLCRVHIKEYRDASYRMRRDRRRNNVGVTDSE